MVTLSVKVVPGSSRDRVVGRYGDGLKVQVSAPPEKGKANDAVIRLLAEYLGVKPQAIELISGATGPRKQFRVAGVEPAALASRLTSFS
jgi:uncharacterized protein (TIGR00251 family)